MKLGLIQLIAVLLYSCSSYKPKKDKIFIKNREFIYQVIYITKNGDTLSNENISLKPLDRRWVGQCRVQESIKYCFNSDTVDLSPIRESKQILINYQKKEITGATVTDDFCFVHPPRANQYYMLRYAGYPYMQYEFLTDTLSSFKFVLREIGKVKYEHLYTITPIKFSINSSYQLSNCWQVNIESEVTGLSDYWKKYHMHNSTCEGIFSKEYGYIKLHYLFEYGIKIQFDLIDIIEK